jgi:hypothetical protein
VDNDTDGDGDDDDDDDDDEYYREVRFVDRHTAAGFYSRGSVTSSSEKSCGYLPTAAKALPIDEASRLVKKTDITKTSTASIPNKVSNLQPLGHISLTLGSLDCAIITVTNHGLAKHLATLQNQNEEYQDQIIVARPRQSQVIAWTSHGAIHGKLVDAPILMQVPGSNLYERAYRFTYKGDIINGDCGSLVTDAETGELYGLIISKSERSRTAYIMAAEKIAQDIENIGGWRFRRKNHTEGRF